MAAATALIRTKVGVEREDQLVAAVLRTGDERRVGEVHWVVVVPAHELRAAPGELRHRIGKDEDATQERAGSELRARSGSISRISFDAVLQRFAHGEAADANAAVIVDILGRFTDDPVNTTPFTSIRTSDGEADVYGLDSAAHGIMVNHASGDHVWDVLFSIADAAALTVIPTGCPACVTNSDVLDDLPEELRTDARVITSGQELRKAISG